MNTAAPTPKTALRSLLREWLPTAVLLLLLLAARSTLADHYHVPSGSMEPTLVPGDRVLVDKAAYGWRVPFTDHVLMGEGAPARGEVVIFDSPEDGTRLIKRVVAVGGDTVRLVAGRLEVNGVRLASGPRGEVEHFGDRAVRLGLGRGGGPDIDGLVVPEGKVLVLGDARGNSHDGRAFGLVDERVFYGRAVGVFYRRDDGFTWRPL